MGDVIVLDESLGAAGEVLRAALALSAATGRAFVLHGGGERLPAQLRPQQRAAVLAAAQLCRAEVSGNEAGSARLTFAPTERPVGGEHAFDAGEGGSATLLLQTLCWPLALAGAPAQLTVRGATHASHAPTFHDLALVWAPAVARLGFRFDLELQAAAFEGEPGGELTARIAPARAMPPLDLRHRGTLSEVEVVASVGGLPYAAAERLAEGAARRLRGIGVASQTTRLPLPTRGSRGCHLLLVATFDRVRVGFGALGGRGEAPEACAESAVEACRTFLEGGAALDAFTGEQLLLPAALLAAGRVPPPEGVVPSVRFTAAALSRGLLAVAEVARRFLSVEVSVVGREGQEGEVRVQPPGAGVEVAPLPA